MDKTLAEKLTDMSENNDIPIKCRNCNYTWAYSGNMIKATCPSCSIKNDVENQRTDK